MDPRYLEERHELWKYILFGILTGGLYQFFVMTNVTRDLNTACWFRDDDRQRDRSWDYIWVYLLSAITLNIYLFVWLYKQGDRMNRCGARYGIGIKEKGLDYMLWYMLSAVASHVLNIVGIFLMIRGTGLGLTDYLDYGSGLSSILNSLGAGAALFLISAAVRLIGRFYTVYLFLGNADRLFAAYNGQIVSPIVNGQAPLGNMGQNPEPRPIPPTQVSSREMKSRSIWGSSGTYAGAVIPIAPGDVMTLGRDGTRCNMVFSDTSISRVHCTIQLDLSGQFYMVMNLSRNGTRINQTTELGPGQSQRCAPGTIISIGDGNNRLTLQ